LSYTLCLKNDTDVALHNLLNCNFNAHKPILIFFGKYIGE